jgi:hypothetical protein
LGPVFGASEPIAEGCGDDGHNGTALHPAPLHPPTDDWLGFSLFFGAFRAVWQPRWSASQNARTAGMRSQNAPVFSNREHLRNVMMTTDFKS